MEAREMEAAAVIGLGARQKTIVEDRKKGERERQIEQIRERVNRIKSARNGRKEVDQNNEFEDLDYADRVKVRSLVLFISFFWTVEKSDSHHPVKNFVYYY